MVDMTQTIDLFPSLSRAIASVEQLAVPSDQFERLREGGADYQPYFINRQEEKELIAAIDHQHWIKDLRRRVQHYGYRYDYKKRMLTENDRIGDLPSWVLPICKRLVEQGVFQKHPDQLIVNEYQPGQGIAPHTDRNCFGSVVASISLGSDCMMNIFPDPKNKKNAFSIVLQHQSLLVLCGMARDKWLHGISPKKTDTQDGSKIPRSRRISLTFRTVDITP